MGMVKILEILDFLEIKGFIFVYFLGFSLLVLNNTIKSGKTHWDLAFNKFYVSSSKRLKLLIGSVYVLFTFLMNILFFYILNSVPLSVGIGLVIVLIISDLLEKDFSKRHLLQVTLNYIPFIYVIIPW